MKDTAPEARGSFPAALRAIGWSLCAALAAAPPAHAQATSAARSLIYDCVGADGKRIRSDRPIPDCRDKDQLLLNPDGSLKGVLPPPATADEAEKNEARERQRKADETARNDAVRRDRNLLARYPNEAQHNKARAMALDDVRKSMQVSEERVALLVAERKPLLAEAEFYVGKSLPSKLKLSIDANDASLDAQKSLIQNQQLEVIRINASYDIELARLRKLWAGVPPGSLGPLPTVVLTPSPKTADIR